MSLTPNALARMGVVPWNGGSAKSPTLHFFTIIGRGNQFWRLPSITTNGPSSSTLNVKGMGPAKRLAAYQSGKGEPAGNGAVDSLASHVSSSVGVPFPHDVRTCVSQPS